MVARCARDWRWWASLSALAILHGCERSVLRAPTPEEDASGSGSGSTSGGEVDCAAFEDARTAEATRFRVVNSRDDDLWVRMYCEQLADRTIVGPDAALTYERDPCDATCSQLQVPPTECGTCPAYVLRLPPGGSFTDVWTGFAAREVDMPAECFHGGTGSSCAQSEAAPEGAHTVSLVGFAECPDCVCSDDGRCEGEPAGPGATATARFDHPTSDDVVLSFLP